MKRKKKEVNKINSSTNGFSEIKKLIIFIVIIAILFCLFYVISLFIDSSNKQTTEQTNEEVTVIQYDKILLGTMLEIENDEFYVLITNEDNLNNSYSVYKTSYESTENSLKIYTADIDSPFNKKYISDKSNFSLNTINDLKISGDTLVKIKDHELVEYFEGKDDIISELKELSE